MGYPQNGDTILTQRSTSNMLPFKTETIKNKVNPSLQINKNGIPEKEKWVTFEDKNSSLCVSVP